MKIHIDVRGSRKTEKSLDISDGATVLELLRLLQIHPDAVICFAGESPVPVDTVMVDGQELTVIEAASGGSDSR